MSLHRYLLAATLLALSVCQAHSEGLRESTTGTTKGRLQPWLVGLAAVAGFLLLVFIVLIAQRLIYGRDDEEDLEVHDNKDADAETASVELKQTVM